MAASPAARAGRALEGTDQVGRDPASVEIALLGHDALLVEPGGVDAPRVERDVITQGFVARRRVGVGPRHRARGPGVEVPGGALEFAPGRARAAGLERG